MLLSFIIPTYNRPEQLEICVKSIAAQIKRTDVQIIVIGLTEENGNKEVCERMQEAIPFLQIIHNPHTDYSENFQAMFRAAAESEWAWTFGDDDVLQPGALDFILKRLEANPTISFYHVAELGRESMRGAVASADTLYSLCCEFGWTEMTGFISGNIARGPMLAACAETPLWREYAKCSYVQSCAILEGFLNEPAALIDLPLIKSQEKDQTAATMETWKAQRIAERYLFVSMAVEKMVEAGILPVEIPAKFFRYLHYHLWDRFMTHFIDDYATREQVWIDDAWANIMRFSLFIKEPEIADRLKRNVEASRGLITLHSYMKRNLDGILVELAHIGVSHGDSIYPYSFVQPITTIKSVIHKDGEPELVPQPPEAPQHQPV